MLMPSIFGDTLLDDFFGFPVKENYKRPSNVNGLMQTDVKETAHGYEVTMNLPGFKKENVRAELKEGYLVVTAATSSSTDEKNEGGKYIRRERYSGTCSRSFFIGEDVEQEDIKAKFQDGILTLNVPKKEEKPKVEESKYIAIEG